MSAILDSIMKITPLQISDFLKFSVHYLCCHIQPITVVTYYVAILSKIVMHFGAIITCLVAILNALIDCRLRLDYQVTIIYLVLMDSLIPKTME